MDPSPEYIVGKILFAGLTSNGIRINTYRHTNGAYMFSLKAVYII